MTRILVCVVVTAAAAASCGGDSGGGGTASGGTLGGGQGGAGGMSASANRTDEEADKVLGPAICGRLQMCAPQIFAQAFPDGDCVGNGIATDPPSMLSQPGPCSDADLQTCAQDVQTFACDAIQMPTLPGSCQKCDVAKLPQTGPNGTFQQTLRRTGWALCHRAYACNQAGFMQQNPHGFSDCVARLWAMVPAAQLAQVSTCSDASAAACVADLKTVTCDALTKGQLPTSCGGGCL